MSTRRLPYAEFRERCHTGYFGLVVGDGPVARIIQRRTDSEGHTDA